ncbi:hypothetical protein [Bacillus sp. mrc49]|uniref:hypothetical protein n=1 Tax=Bacillus sp. mrc49 TaxID=2054913 RepID=UPI000C27B585|nr:hypothetical protein [Bacillus sp. mrc49]PJN87589.1 hypothetical protein CVN76_25035 [Bacillus sp. mrc49]
MLARQGLMRISGYLLHGCRGRPIGRFLLACQMDTDEEEKTAKDLEGGARLTCYKKAKNGGKDGDRIEQDFSQALM